MFNSQLTIKETALYRFSITSDDGSILWLDDEMVINNDFSMGMHAKADTIALKPGKYDIKLWYYQAYPTMLGFIFDSHAVEGEVISKVDTIMLDQDVMFTTGSSRLNLGSSSILDSLGKRLDQYEKAMVSIIGHTDNIGTESYNQQLSESRANAIKNYLIANIEHLGVSYITKGLGETQPLGSNENKKGRAKNRRVEILVEAY